MIEHINNNKKEKQDTGENVRFTDIDSSFEHGILPEVSLSACNIEVDVEEGDVYRGSFVVESTNEVPMKGFVYSTSDKVETEIASFEGTKAVIPYYFKGKLVSVGDFYEGDFVIVTNGGEFNLPYRFMIIHKQMDSSMGKLGTLSEFTTLYQEQPKEALELFFLPKFETVFLAEDPVKQSVYHNLMKGRSKKLILEEFLVSTGCKKQALLTVDDTQVTMDSGSTSQTLTLKLDPYGYVEGTIKSQKGQVQLSVNKFTSEDFADGQLTVTVEKNLSFALGNDTITIKTVHQNFEIGLEWWGTLPVDSKERDINNRIKRERAELLHNYLYFRTGSIEFEDFVRDSGPALDDLIYLTDDVEYKLYEMHLLLMEEKKEEAEQKLKELDKILEEKPERFHKLASCYFLYLKAMFYRTPESISQAVLSIREYYEAGENKAEAFWMLIYLDRDYVYNKKLQYDTIKQLFEQGNNSSLLYFEACEILNDNPGYMDELGVFELNVIRWGVRYGYISLSLAYQFARLSLRTKYFNPSIFHLAQKLYRVEPDERFLQVICSLLIKGNRVSTKYHEYFHQGVEASLKIVGLNEFFIRSMDFTSYEKIPPRVLIYFTYSNSLDVKEKAYLFCNILHNKESYSEVYDAYFSKMAPFVEEQLLKGKINEHLAYLYTYFQKSILEKPENAKAVCDILFYRRLVCENPEMIGVYVYVPETDEETYYPLSGGTCNIEFYNYRTKLFFVDLTEQRYLSGIRYHFENFLTLEQMPKKWIVNNLANTKLFITMTGCVGKTITDDNVEVLERLVKHGGFKDWILKQALEELLTYYGNHQEKEKMARVLERTDYTNITSKFRRQLMNYYLEVGMTENALFGVELYGTHILGAAKRLKLASFGVHQIGDQRDETILGLCYTAFIRKKHNKDSLGYLMKHFDGEMEDLISIWERSRKFELETTEFEKHILKQAAFTSNMSEIVYPVFLSCRESEREAKEVLDYLKFISVRELAGAMELPDNLHMMIGEEILADRINDLETKIHFLYHFENKPEWHEQIAPTVQKIVNKFLAEKYYLPVFHGYAEYLKLPVEYEELTFLTYKGEVGKKVILYYQIEGDKVASEAVLDEIVPGIYLCSLHFYRNDHVMYQLEVDGESAGDQDVKFETFEYEGEDSRFFALNHLSHEDCTMQDIHDYMIRAYFTDEYMTLM